MYNTIRVYVSPERHFQINISALHTKILKYNLFNIKKLPTFSYIFCGSMHISVVLHLKYRPERQSLTGNSIITSLSSGPSEFVTDLWKLVQSTVSEDVDYHFLK